MNKWCDRSGEDEWPQDTSIHLLVTGVTARHWWVKVSVSVRAWEKYVLKEGEYREKITDRRKEKESKREREESEWMCVREIGRETETETETQRD